MTHRKHVLLALSWYHPQIHEGVIAFAREHNWLLNHALIQSTAAIPYGWNGDGLICNDAFHNKERADFFGRLTQPKVILNHGFEQYQNHITVSDDHDAIADLAVDHFLSHNFSRFACYAPYESAVGERIHRFTKQLSKQGYNCDLIIPPKEARWIDERHEWLMDYLRKLPKPVAIFGQSDDWAGEIIQACEDANVKIPSDIAVLGVRNDRLICNSLHVSLSSIDNNLYGVGYKAAEELHKLMNGENPEIRHYTIPPNGIHIRQSTNMFSLPPGNENLQRALEMIHKEYLQTDLSSDQIAEHASMSKRSLYASFEKIIGQSPRQMIINLRVEKAKELLTETSYELADIVNRSGFQSLRNFYLIFKKIVGQPPAKYRALYQRKK